MPRHRGRDLGKPEQRGGKPDTNAPSFFAVANTAGMTELALTVFLRISHPTMPNFILPDADTRDVIAYILSLKR